MPQRLPQASVGQVQMPSARDQEIDQQLTQRLGSL
jgi:hypothetical protein